MQTKLRHLAALGAVAVAVIGLGACSSGGTTGTAASTVTTGPTATGTPGAAGRVDANTSTVAELTAAFQAAGIPSAPRWAHEVEEYRPYPTDDPTFAKLRSELAKYHPSDQVVDQIVASLTLQ